MSQTAALIEPLKALEGDTGSSESNTGMAKKTQSMLGFDSETQIVDIFILQT